MNYKILMCYGGEESSRWYSVIVNYCRNFAQFSSYIYIALADYKNKIYINKLVVYDIGVILSRVLGIAIGHPISLIFYQNNWNKGNLKTDFLDLILRGVNRDKDTNHYKNVGETLCILKKLFLPVSYCYIS